MAADDLLRTPNIDRSLMGLGCYVLSAALSWLVFVNTVAGNEDVRSITRSSDAPAQRDLALTYAATIRGFKKADHVRVWVPMPQTTAHQRVVLQDVDVPAKASYFQDPKYGNKLLYFEQRAPADAVSFSMRYGVQRKEMRALTDRAREESLQDRVDLGLYLSPNSRVPLTGKPLSLIAEMKLAKSPLALARQLYDRVDEHVRYDKSLPGYGNGDVLWVCDSQFGNCTDFHSLFISLARSQGIPARFEIGFPLPAERGTGVVSGYHCWAFFHTAEYGWVPVDISEADKTPQLKDYYFGNLTENRVGFTIGRDIELRPAAEQATKNFFIFPHVEVNGESLPQERVELKVSYADGASS